MLYDIYITIGASQIKEKGYRKYVKDFWLCDGIKGVWYYRMKNRPQREINKVYIVIGNKVRWRGAFVGYDSGPKEFFDGSIKTAENWMMIADFERLAAPQEIKKGFQGIRYKELDLT